MSDYPTTKPERFARRKSIYDQAYAKAERDVAELGRSMTCAGVHVVQDHARCAGPTRCLCECHDPETTP